MTVEEFLLGRPCLEELDGYLMGLRLANEMGLPTHYPEVNADVLGPIETYRAKLLAGKETPTPSKLAREWEYAPRKNPKKLRRPMADLTEDVLEDIDEHADQKDQSTQSEHPEGSHRKPLVLDKSGGKSGKGKVRVLRR